MLGVIALEARVPVEELDLVLELDPHTLVDNGHLTEPCDSVQRDIDVTTGWRELHRVGKQVAEDDPHPVVVAHDIQLLRERLEDDAVDGIVQGSGHLDRLLGHSSEVEALGPYAQAAL